MSREVKCPVRNAGATSKHTRVPGAIETKLLSVGILNAEVALETLLLRHGQELT